MLLRRLAPAALALSLALPALAANEKGYLRIDGVQGPSTAVGHAHWFDMPSSEVTVDAAEGVQCTAIVDALARHAAPLLVGLAGDTVPEIEIELANYKGQVYYELRMTDVRVVKAVTTSTRGVHVETLHLEPSSMVFRVKELEPSGQLGPAVTQTVSCGGGRT